MLDWNYFKKLSGDVRLNFEKICRAVINEKYSDKGVLRETFNQPGVEFYLKLNQSCARLGEKGQQIGWQCKWFDLRKNGQLTSSSKRQIQESLNKTKEHVASLDKWILWTHKVLSAPDQKWFFALQEQYSFKLVLWNDNDLDELLSGSALHLRETYFGELALTSEELKKQFELSIAPIALRWMEALHQTTPIEIEIRKILGEISGWEEIIKCGDKLNEEKELIDSLRKNAIYKPWTNDLEVLVSFIEEIVELTAVFNDKIQLQTIKQRTAKSILTHLFSQSRFSAFYKLLRQLRVRNLTLSLSVTNVLFYLKRIAQLLTDFEKLVKNQFIAVIGNAGDGKTQLSIEITKQTANRPAGVLILGRNLAKGASIDDLVRANIAFNGNPVKSIDSLLAALNAVADRNDCRLPIVIDGLNESESPRQWKDILSRLMVSLEKYPNVVLICTMRPHIQGMSNDETAEATVLPNGFKTLFLDGFEELTSSAISKYFKHYNISLDLLSIPLDFFSHPLTLRLFCEAMEGECKIGYIPSSVSALFDQRIEHSLANISTLHPAISRTEISRAIYVLGQCLFESGRRCIYEDNFINRFGKDCLNSDWNQNLINLLVQEGLIFRNEIHNRPYKYELMPTFDLLGGYLISRYLLRTYSSNDLNDWINRVDIAEKIFEKHELSNDILHSLIPQIPKNYGGKQLWSSLENPKYQILVLDQSHLIDQSNFDKNTRDKYKERLLEQMKEHSFSVFRKLNQFSCLVSHPLNAFFEDEILSELSMPIRDIYWTEFLRMNKPDILKKLKYFQNRCQNSGASFEVLKLLALHTSWMLTSTDTEIRDEATKSLVLFGLNYPEDLFELTIKRLEITEPYVQERLLSASYVVSTQCIADPLKHGAVTKFATELYEKMFNSTAEFPTTHALMLDYAFGILNAAKEGIKTSNRKNEIKDLYKRNALKKVWGEEKEDRVTSPIRLDFGNYTIGRLIPNRMNYDFSNPEYVKVRSNILWRIFQLGWNAKLFLDIDKKISSLQSRVYKGKTERYGKKYSWIAYYEMLGYRLGLEELSLDEWQQRFHSDIDPFFPRQIEFQEKEDDEFLGQKDVNTQDWINGGFELDSLISRINDKKGQWVAINATFLEESLLLDRSFMCFLHAFLVSKETLPNILSEKSDLSADAFNDIDTGWYNIYSGELYENTENESILEELSKIGICIKSGGKIQKVDIFQTTMNYSWSTSGIDEHNFSETLLSPPLVKKLHLFFDPITFSYLDQNNDVAVKVVKEQGRGSWNKKVIVYIRRDLISNLLDSENLALVYCCRGERRLSLSGHYDESGSVPYKTFKENFLYQFNG